MDTREKILSEGKISSLIIKYSIPAILSGLISAIYNIVDQIFIGQSVGILGNSATNVVFPIVMVTNALSTLIGIGTAGNFSLARGRRDIEKSKIFIANGLVMAFAWGIIIAILTQIFTDEILTISGATAENFQYAKTYLNIISLGFPFFVFSVAISQMIRADGSPKYAMITMASGAVLNIVLDAIFIFGFQMGMKGAALATIIGQFVSTILAVKYLFNFKSFKLTKEMFKIKLDCIMRIFSLGIAPFVNQISISITQIAMNNALLEYGSSSIYGSDIPLATFGIVSKVNMIFITIAIGIGQGSQPIIGFNYGAKRYDRVLECITKNLKYASIVSILAFCAFQVFPRQITALFGDGSSLYFEFSERFFRVFMMMAFLNGIQPIAGNFFTSIGKATKGVFMSLTKQILFLLPLLVILPKFFGLDGVLYAGPVADIIAVIVATTLLTKEYRYLKALEKAQKESGI